MKTIEDVLKYLDDGNTIVHIDIPEKELFSKLYFKESEQSYMLVHEHSQVATESLEGWQYICTREELEKAREEHKSYKRVLGVSLIDGDIINTPKGLVYIYFKGNFYLFSGKTMSITSYSKEWFDENMVSLTRAGEVLWQKKPTLTKAEAWEMLYKKAGRYPHLNLSDTIKDVIAEYDVE